MAMRDGLRLYWLYVKLSIRAQLQYRAAFCLAALGQFLVNGIEFLGVWALFERFGRLYSWSLPEVAVFYGLVNCTFACADALSTGFDYFGVTYIKTDILIAFYSVHAAPSCNSQDTSWLSDASGASSRASLCFSGPLPCSSSIGRLDG